MYKSWRQGPHEIDYLAWEKGELVCVEVRTLTANVPWLPEVTITPRKQASLRRAMEAFLAANPAYTPLHARMDVVAIRLAQPPEIHLIPDAFR